VFLMTLVKLVDQKGSVTRPRCRCAGAFSAKLRAAARMLLCAVDANKGPSPRLNQTSKSAEPHANPRAAIGRPASRCATGVRFCLPMGRNKSPDRSTLSGTEAAKARSAPGALQTAPSCAGRPENEAAHSGREKAGMPQAQLALCKPHVCSACLCT
jgi:hypothetical protein